MSERIISRETTINIVRCKCGTPINVVSKNHICITDGGYFDKYTGVIHPVNGTIEWDDVCFICPKCGQSIGRIDKMYIINDPL